jgi:hypothetical protein
MDLCNEGPIAKPPHHPHGRGREHKEVPLVPDITVDEMHGDFVCESWRCRKRFPAPLPAFEGELPACLYCGSAVNLKLVLVRREVWAPLEVPALGQTTICWEID